MVNIPDEVNQYHTNNETKGGSLFIRITREQTTSPTLLKLPKMARSNNGIPLKVFDSDQRIDLHSMLKGQVTASLLMITCFELSSH
jgi:hypothetical protein